MKEIILRVSKVLNKHEKHIQSETNEGHKDFNCSHLFYEQSLIPTKVWVEEILNDFILNIS